MVSTARAEKAPAKINLTLRVLDRRADGYHELESLVAFAGVGDALTFAPGGALTLAVSGPTPQAVGDNADNLVLKAARAPPRRIRSTSAASRLEALAGRGRIGRRLGGRGGGLRLLARAQRVALDDPRLMQAAQATGSDVPVCLIRSRA
jgi:4-diphosphocytidyl-2-C-methyl-D-erythritol kinase